MAATPPDQAALQERYVEMKLIEKEAQQIKSHLQVVEEQMHEVRHNAASITDIAKVKPGEEILVPIASGIFAKGTIKNTKNLLVGVGASIVVQKDIPSTIAILDKRIASLEKYQTELIGALNKLEERALAVDRDMRALSNNMQ